MPAQRAATVLSLVACYVSMSLQHELTALLMSREYDMVLAQGHLRFMSFCSNRTLLVHIHHPLLWRDNSWGTMPSSLRLTHLHRAFYPAPVVVVTVARCSAKSWHFLAVSITSTAVVNASLLSLSTHKLSKTAGSPSW
jgi:uncharacterized membrane protein